MNEVEYNYEQHIEFVLGFAGSGKSTELAKRAKPDWIILTPTHKAKEVLQAKGLGNVFTIHSVLKLVPTLNMDMKKGEKVQRLSRIGDVDLENITHIAIDEFSMINTYILDLLLDLLPASTPVTIFGDPYQLAPVDGDPIEPEFYAREITHLTKQHRAEAPEVVETFMRFMEYIKTQDSSIDLRLNPKIKQGTVAEFNPLTDRALAFTNARVLEINNDIASVLQLPDEISTGEDIVANSIHAIMADGEYKLPVYPKCTSKGKLMEGRKLEDTIEAVHKEIRKFGTDLSPYETAKFEIDGEVYQGYIDYNHYENSKALMKEVEEAQFYLYDQYNIPDEIKLSDWCRSHRTLAGVSERGQAWSVYLAHKNLVWDIRRPFASTVHKSQGSEFETVYIDQDDMKKAIRRGYYLQYAILMYVSLSRAIKKVVII